MCMHTCIKTFKNMAMSHIVNLLLTLCSFVQCACYCDIATVMNSPHKMVLNNISTYNMQA